MKYYLDIKVYPKQSLTYKGLLFLMLFITIPASYIGISFYIIGAWPVLGFMGLEIIFIYIAFKVLFNRNGSYEHILLDKTKLKIFYKSKKEVIKEVEIEPTWLKVKIEDIYKNKNVLTLSSHGKKIVLGSFLIPEERQKLAKEIRYGLNKWKNQYSTN